MDGDRPLKQHLPYPFNQDLSEVLVRLDRRTILGRERLANDPATAAYLAAALRLVRQHLGPHEPSGLAASNEDVVDRPLLAFLSQRAVVAEMAGNPHPFPRQGTVAGMRATWKSQSDFLADLLSFALWTGYYPETYKRTIATGAENLVHAPNFADVVEGLAYRIASALAEMVSFRLQLVAIATVHGDDVVRRALARKYARGLKIWRQVYAEFITARGLRLRPGVTLDDFTNLLTAQIEGLMLRELSDPDAHTIDHDDGRSLLGTAALALINGCLERVTDSDGRSLAQAVDHMAGQPVRPPAPEPPAPPEETLLMNGKPTQNGDHHE